MKKFVLVSCLFLLLVNLASATVTLSDGTVVEDNQLADTAVDLQGLVYWYENGDGIPGCIDLDPMTYSYFDNDNSLAAAGTRTIMEVSWSNCTVKNGPGIDLMTGEVGSNEGSMVSINVEGSGWTGYYWVQPLADIQYPDNFYSAYDFSNIGVADNATITAVRFSNVLPGPTAGLYRTYDDFGNSIDGTLGAGLGYKLSATDADPRYIAALNVGSAVVSLPGDANDDGAVDVGDLGILAANYGTLEGATWGQGDFNGDGAVDVGDLGILAANYGTTAAAAVPEPLTLGLLGFGGLALIRKK